MHRSVLSQPGMQMVPGRFWWMVLALKPVHTNVNVKSNIPGSLGLITKSILQTLILCIISDVTIEKSVYG